MAKLQSIQVLRGVAAVGVVLLHATTLEGHPLDGFYWGGAGVDLFFVISGFIIGTVAPGHAPAEFLLRRMWRIYPLWWLASIAWLIAYPSVSASEHLTNITLWPVWGEYVSTSLWVGWTLCFEMLFYLGAALALAMRAWVPMALFAIAAMAAPFTDNAAVDFIGNAMILEFLFGLALSRLPTSPFAPYLLLIGIVGVALAPAAFSNSAVALDADLSWMRAIVWGVPCALILQGARSFEVQLSRWSFAILLGNASYSIYLFHSFAVWLVPGHWSVKFVAGVGFGLLLYFTVERRLIWLGGRKTVRAQA